MLFVFLLPLMLVNKDYQNCAAFNRGNLTFWRYQKLSRINSGEEKREHWKCEHFIRVTANVQNLFR